MVKIKLSGAQFERLSEILGNICVAWFTFGVIAPIIIHPASIFEFIQGFMVSLFMSGSFLAVSLLIIKESRK